MDIRAADEEERDHIVRALADRRYQLRERAQKEVLSLCGQHSTVEIVVAALGRHIAGSGELRVRDSDDHARSLGVDRVYEVEFDFGGRRAFSHFYLLSPESSLRCRVLFESLHPSNS